MQAIRADYFGTSNFGKIMGVSSLIVTLGNTTGPIVAGVLADRTGNYEAGFRRRAVGVRLLPRGEEADSASAGGWAASVRPLKTALAPARAP
jgi:hypothetical protein